MMNWLIFLDYIRSVMSNIDSGLYAKVFQFTTVDGLPVFIMEWCNVVVICALHCTTSIRQS
jgi:hypothetical protein